MFYIGGQPVAWCPFTWKCNTRSPLGITQYHGVTVTCKNCADSEKWIKCAQDEQSHGHIWVKISQSKKIYLIVGGVYREHQQLGIADRPTTRMEIQCEQELRWDKIVKRWVNISKNVKCVVIGDVNLDKLRWQNPKQHLVKMVDTIKEHIETQGFSQLINGVTRGWRHQNDSCLDHIWTNCGNRTLWHFSELRGSSEHNIIGIDIATRDIKIGGNNTVKQVWRDFNKKRFLNKLMNIDWSLILNRTNVNIVNTLFENFVGNALEEEAPLKVVQQRTKYCKWLSRDTKELIVTRDETWGTARRTDSIE